MVATFAPSTFVVGPAISGSAAQPERQPAVNQPTVDAHGH